MSQARGTATIFGEGWATITCTGETQTVVVRVAGGVFHGGPALVYATLLQWRFEEGFGQVCHFTDISTSEEILIRGA